MKNKFLAPLFLFTVIVMVASCATSRKYGCPMATTKIKSSNS
ncbi:MAG TPA: hypothetical protein VF487_06965 [Chitinophagaceae bacterium]